MNDEYIPSSEKTSDQSNIGQLDGNDTDFDTDDEVDNEPVRAVLVPSAVQGGPQSPLRLEVDSTGQARQPLCVPLCVVTNPRSCYNKIDNLCAFLSQIGPDLCILSEHWGRKKPLEETLRKAHFKILEYSRGTSKVPYKCKKEATPKTNPTGGGVAIIYNEENFHVEKVEIDIPEGVEATWAILTPQVNEPRKYKNILVGAVYIAPRTEYKQETIQHIIEVMQCMQARFDDQLGHIVTGDFNKTDITDILDSDGSLMQVCSVATRDTAVLEYVITNMATLFHPPTTLPPLKQDENKNGKPSDHNMIVMAPRSNIAFQQKRKKRKVTIRPMPESKVHGFLSDLANHSWREVLECENANVKTVNFHSTLTQTLSKHFKEKHVNMTSLDKKWFNPALKLQHKEMQFEFYKSGKSKKWRTLRTAFRRAKRSAVKTFYSKFVSELKTTNPSMYYKMAKRIGAGGKKNSGDIVIECLEGLGEQEQVEAVADYFASVSQEYEPVDLTLLPAYLPALPPPQVDVWTVMKRIETQKKTKTTLPIDLPESLRKKSAVFLAEPLTDIINTSLKQGTYGTPWKFEWVSVVPKLPRLQVLKHVRKIVSTSDYSKVYEGFLKEWIIEDISDNLNLSQYGGKKGVGTEHMIVNLVDRILKLLDGPESTAVIKTCADWSDAFSRVDPTKAISKFIMLGVRSSLIPVLIDFLTGRKMKCKMNGKWSKIKNLIGGGPQGSIVGQQTYLVSSEECPQDIQTDDAYKYIDDLEVLELVFLSGVLIDYDFTTNVASDIGIDQKFLPPSLCQTQNTINGIASWTQENKVKLNE